MIFSSENFLLTFLLRLKLGHATRWPPSPVPGIYPGYRPACPRSLPQPVFSVTSFTLSFRLTCLTLVKKLSSVDSVTRSLCFVLNSITKSQQKYLLLFIHIAYKTLEGGQATFLTSAGFKERWPEPRPVASDSRIVGRACVGRGWAEAGRRTFAGEFQCSCSPEVLRALGMERILFLKGNSFPTGTSAPGPKLVRFAQLEICL